MTQDDIVKMALEAGYQSVYLADVPAGRSYQFLERFAALVVTHEREKHSSPSWETVDDAIAAEREECAKVCELIGQGGIGDIGDDTTALCATHIRARGENAG